MAKRTQEQVFLDKLAEMANDTMTGRVNSAALEGALGWQLPGRYGAIRKKLIDKKSIRAFTGGPGGSLELNSPDAKQLLKPVSAFLSYSHADADLKDELLKHPAPLKRLELVDHWHDGDITAGEEWEKKIINHLRTADIIILLISVDFINSKYCYEKELKAAIDRHNSKKATIIPVIGRNCLWTDLPFGKIQATLGGKSISAWPDRDDALTEVAKAIRVVAEGIRSNRGPA